MKGLLRQDKGVSIMIGYVLLVVIAVALATLVFTFMKVYVPTNQPVCPDNIALSIEELSCQNGAVRIQMMNRGLFSLDGAYIRIGEPGREYRTLLNADNVRFFDYFDEKGLPPSALWPKGGEPMNYDYSETGTRIVEIEPALFVNDEWVLCNKAIIKQEIECLGSVLSVQITEPSKNSYDILEEVPLAFSIYNGQTPYTCWYNLNNGPDVDVDCSNPGSLVNLIEDSYYLIVHVKDNLGEEATGNKRFDVTSTPGQFILSSPLLDNYEYIDGILNPSSNNILLNYDFNGLATSCKAELFDPLGALKSTINLCADNRQMPPALFSIDSDVGNYNLKFTNVANNQEVYNKYFGVLVDPDITIDWEVVNPTQCNFNLNYEMIERKYDLNSNCYIQHRYESDPPGIFRISPCDTRIGTISFVNLLNGRHQFIGHIEDTANPIKIVETLPLIIDVSGDPMFCTQKTGGQVYAL